MLSVEVPTSIKANLKQNFKNHILSGSSAATISVRRISLRTDEVSDTQSATPESFKNVAHGILSLHAMLKEIGEIYPDAILCATQQSRLKILEDGCRAVLEDLQVMIDQYDSLGTKSKHT